MPKVPVTQEEVAKEAKDGQCPWCNYENTDELIGEVHKPRKNQVILTVNSIFQCLTCGKTWAKEALGKPWTLALEMGAAWERENKAKQLRGI